MACRISVPPRKQMDNNNPKPEVERILRTVLENLRELAHTPSKLQELCQITALAFLPYLLILKSDLLLCTASVRLFWQNFVNWWTSSTLVQSLPSHKRVPRCSVNMRDMTIPLDPPLQVRVQAF